MVTKPSCILVFLLEICSVFSANILYACPMPSPSHHIWNRALALGLVSKGHNVTYISPDKDDIVKPKNYTHFVMEGIYDQMNQDYSLNDMASYGSTEIIFAYQDWSISSCKMALETKNFQKLLNYPLDFKFDLIILDVTTGSCFYPLIKRFNYPPSIAVTAFLLPQYVSNSFGNILFPTFIPWYGLPYTTEMDFIERLWNFFFTYFDIFVRYQKLYPSEHELAKEVFGPNTPPMKELERHMSLVLSNTDPILDHPQPLPPNIIPVGGLHTRKPKPVSQDLQQILDKSTNGVILFSLGTNIRSDKLDAESQSELLKAFSKIKETVIWKFESDIQNLPKNVIIRKWLPQNDILGHPNVKLFIGHGGSLSTQEAVFHGVPMIAIPFIVDQYINTKIILKKKLGLTIENDKITAENVLVQLREVLDNPLYAENMKKLSKAFKDKPQTPLEKGIFWIEYVLRHGGADFLNLPARDMPLYKSTGADIIAFLLVIIVSSLLILCKVVKIAISLLAKTKKIKTH